METYARSRYHAVGIVEDFAQDNMSYSVQNVLRGLHCDQRLSKLVNVVHGEVFDVIVDARAGSPTFGRWISFGLSDHNHHQIYIPAGCLHGFLAVSPEVVLCYKQSAEYAPEHEIAVRWDDPTLNIGWPDLGFPPTLSGRDQDNKLFEEAFPRDP